MCYKCNTCWYGLDDTVHIMRELFILRILPLNDFNTKPLLNRYGALVLKVLSFLIVLIMPACSRDSFGSTSGADVTEVQQSETVAVEAVIVGVDRAQKESVDFRLELSGEVFARNVVSVQPDTSGVLTRVLVNPGEYITYDQILAWVDPSRPGMSYSESPVRSKTAGSVLAVHAVAGNRVSPQSMILEIGNLESLEVKLRVPERYLDYLRHGMTARLESRSYPGEKFGATVTEIAPVVDRLTRTIEVTLVPAAGHRFRSGQSVDIELVLDRRIDALTVPVGAVTERSSGLGVFVVRENRVEWQSVESGYRNGERLQVFGNLKSTDVVVIAGIEELTDGSRIRITD